MTKEYCKYTHTHVIISHPDNADGWSGPQEILLHTSTHVWVPGCYAMLGHADLRQAGIGGASASAFDEDGNCIIAVPLAWCRSFHDPGEAESIEQCMDADDRLLSYARG